MIDDKIKKWVDDCINQGYSKEKIIQNLTNFGYSKEEIRKLTDDIKQETTQKEIKKNNLSFIKEVISILKNPTKYFQENDKYIKNSLIYLTRISLISFSPTILFMLIVLYFISSFLQPLLSIININLSSISLKLIILSVITLAVIGISVSIISSFINSLIIYIFVLILNKKSDFSNIYFSYVISLTPLLILTFLNLIPIIGTLCYIISIFYSFYILITGISIKEKTTKLKASLAIIIPQIIIITVIFSSAFMILNKSQNIENILYTKNILSDNTNNKICNPISISLENYCKTEERINIKIKNKGITFSEFNYYLNDKLANKQKLIFETEKTVSFYINKTNLNSEKVKNKFKEINKITIIPISNNIECVEKAANIIEPIELCKST